MYVYFIYFNCKLTNYNCKYWSGDVAQEVEHLLSKYKTLSLMLSTAKKKYKIAYICGGQYDLQIQ
jgi:hypothetical protein